VRSRRLGRFRNREHRTHAAEFRGGSRELAAGCWWFCRHCGARATRGNLRVGFPRLGHLPQDRGRGPQVPVAESHEPCRAGPGGRCQRDGDGRRGGVGRDPGARSSPPLGGNALISTSARGVGKQGQGSGELRQAGPVTPPHGPYPGPRYSAVRRAATALYARIATNTTIRSQRPEAHGQQRRSFNFNHQGRFLNLSR
jgi:hypothetical protein